MAGRGTLQSVLEKFRKQEDMNAAVNRKAAEAWARKKAMKKAKDEAKRKAAEAAAAAAAAAEAAAAAAAGAGPSSASALPDTSSKAALRTSVLPTAVPLAKQVKDALAALATARGGAPLTAAALSAACGHDASPATPLGRALADHAKVAVGGDGTLRYRAAHDATDAEGLVAAVAAAAPGGVPAAELDDAYPGAADDVAALVAGGRLWALPRPADGGGGSTLFHPGGDVAPAPPSVATLWAATPAPADPDALEAALRRAGIKPAPRRAPRRKPPPGPRAPRRRAEGAPRVVTNAHLPGLFVGAGATSIDGPV